jgi:putative tryptophan/tyrosine transport system substrate-binding protein
MHRREFIVLLGAATVWPLGVCAQQPAPMIGFLSGASRETSDFTLVPFRNGLAEAGYAEGRNIAIEYRFAEEQYDRLPTLAFELARLQVGVIVTAGNVAAHAASKATATIPIVFHTGDDPIAVGLVSNLARPGGNMTGVTAMAGALPGKRLELLLALVPGASAIVVLINPDNANARPDSAAFRAAAGALGRQIEILHARTDRDIESNFVMIGAKRDAALLVNTDAFLTSRNARIVELAALHKVPTIYSSDETPKAGGLMSYGAARSDTYRQVGLYVGRILKGAKPAELPVLQPTRFELVINLNTAKALGLTVPPMLLARADEVIE